MDISGVDIQIACHNKALRYRKQDRLVQTYEFIEAWSAADAKQRKNVVRLLRHGRYRAIKTWMKSVFNDALWCNNILELRELARKYYIKNYSRLSKQALITVILQEKEADDAASERLADYSVGTTR